MGVAHRGYPIDAVRALFLPTAHKITGEHGVPPERSAKVYMDLGTVVASLTRFLGVQ
jgi:hypothetical protein